MLMINDLERRHETEIYYRHVWLNSELSGISLAGVYTANIRSNECGVRMATSCRYLVMCYVLMPLIISY